MDTFKIIISPYDLFFTDTSSDVSMIFYVWGNGIAFPSEDWEDYAYPALHQWIESLLRSGFGKNAYRLYFLDGPYYIAVKQNGDELEMRFIHDSGLPKEEAVVYCTKRQLFIELRRAIKDLGTIVADESLLTNRQLARSIQESNAYYNARIRRWLLENGSLTTF
jgi:hypothetical protein